MIVLVGGGTIATSLIVVKLQALKKCQGNKWQMD